MITKFRLLIASLAVKFGNYICPEIEEVESDQSDYNNVVILDPYDDNVFTSMLYHAKCFSERKIDVIVSAVRFKETEEDDSFVNFVYYWDESNGAASIGIAKRLLSVVEDEVYGPLEWE